jgi:hypothetical protein
MFYPPKSQPWPNDHTNPIFIKIPPIYLSYWKVVGKSDGIRIKRNSGIFNKFERTVPTLTDCQRVGNDFLSIVPTPPLSSVQYKLGKFTMVSQPIDLV